MTNALIVFCSCSNEEEAIRIAHTLLNEKLAACVNVLPPVRSIYRWQGKVEDTAEIPLTIKTTEHCFPLLRDRIFSLHSYDTPEIIAIPVVAGSEKYLAWLGEQVYSFDVP